MVQVRVEEFPFVVVLDGKSNGFSATGKVADAVVARVVKQHAFPERASVVRSVVDAGVARELRIVDREEVCALRPGDEQELTFVENAV